MYRTTFFGSLCLLASHVCGQELSTVPLRLMPGAPFEVFVQDTWPNSCVPRSATLSVSKAEIVLQATDVSAADCKAISTPYELAVKARLPVDWPSDQDAVPLLFTLRRAGSGDSNRAAKLVAIGGTPRRAAESGIYWNDSIGAYPNSGPGVGITLDVQGERASVMAFYYDLGGNPVWYFGNGEIVADELKLDLHLLRGGQTLLGDYRAPTDTLSAAELLIKFSSPSRFTALVSVPQGEGRALQVLSQTQSMVRFSIGYGPDNLRLGGAWAVLIGADTIRLELVSNEAGDLVDLRRGYALKCRRAQVGAEPPPRNCELSDSRDRVVADFDQIGLERMRGLSPAGATVVAVRLD